MKQTESMTTSNFKIGTTYQMRFIGDSDLKVNFTCISRTEKTVKLQRTGKSEIISRKVKVYDSVEYVIEGSYSMAPSIYSNKIVKL